MSNQVQTQTPDVVDQADNHDRKSPEQSFGELRKAKEDLERELWQVKKERELERQMQAQQHANHSQPVEEDFDFNQLENEEFPDGKKLLKAFNQVNKKLSNYDKKLAEKDQKIMILELSQNLPDFKEVVTAENFEKYIKSDEDNLESVSKADNPLRKAYNLIKKDSRYQADKVKNVEKDKPISQEQQRLNDKESVPRHTGVGVRSEAITIASQMSNYSNSTMTKEMREQLWKETQGFAKKAPR